jgi:hypothetical protein
MFAKVLAIYKKSTNVLELNTTHRVEILQILTHYEISFSLRCTEVFNISLLSKRIVLLDCGENSHYHLISSPGFGETTIIGYSDTY